MNLKVDFFRDLAISAITAVLMYLSSVPYPEVAMVTMMGGDLMIGTIEAFLFDRFKVRTLRNGVMRKAMALVMVGATALVEPSINHISGTMIELDLLVIYGITAYEFLSIAESYGRLDGPGASFVTSVTSRIKDAFAEKKAERKEERTN